MSNRISSPNAQKLDDLVQTVVSQYPGHVLKIGIDGFCAAGKTTIANDLSERIRENARTLIRATTDDFQNPPEIRWRLGDDSPLGFYRDAIDFEALERELLLPLSLGGNGLYRTSTYDIQNLRPNLSPVKKADPDAILIVDGLFLQVPRLKKLWDFLVFVTSSYETCIARAITRNQENIDDSTELEQLYRNRYVVGYEIYRKEVEPERHAIVLIETD